MKFGPQFLTKDRLNRGGSSGLYSILRYRTEKGETLRFLRRCVFSSSCRI